MDRRRAAVDWNRTLYKRWKKVKWHIIKWIIFQKVVYGSYSGKEKYKEEINFLKRERKLVPFPYEYIKKYKFTGNIQTDESGNKYVLQQGNRRLYLKKDEDMEDMGRYLAMLEIEQDIESPHRYFTEYFHPGKEDVFIDVGTAEGMEAVGLLGRVKHMHLFDADPLWIDSLQKTFGQHSDSVKIHQKMVSRETGGADICSLDSLFGNLQEHYFLKIDVEGMELDVLEGAEHILNMPYTKVAVATYHEADAAARIECYLKDRGFQTEFSKGYGVWIYAPKRNLVPPYFRKCVLRAWKEQG